MRCPKCGSEDRHKAGFIGAAQRWRCRACGCKFTRSTPPGKPPELRAEALRLYREGMGFRAIGRALEVSNVTVLNWIRAFGEDADRGPEPEDSPRLASADPESSSASSEAAPAAPLSAGEEPKT